MVADSSVDSFLNHKNQLYPINKANKIAHSRQKTCWSRSINNTMHVIVNRNAQSLYTNFFCTSIGATKAESQSINHKLKIFDHIIFPTDKDPFQLIADIADKNNSGADVPIAKTVNQISREETLKYLAILTLVFIK